MKEITDITRSQPADGFVTVKLIDKTDTNPSTKIEGQKGLNRVVTSNNNFINKLVAVTSLGTNISQSYKTWLHFFSLKETQIAGPEVDSEQSYNQAAQSSSEEL